MGHGVCDSVQHFSGKFKLYLFLVTLSRKLFKLFKQMSNNHQAKRETRLRALSSTRSSSSLKLYIFVGSFCRISFMLLSGEYQCVAENDNGAGESNPLEIQVLCKLSIIAFSAITLIPSLTGFK